MTSFLLLLRDQQQQKKAEQSPSLSILLFFNYLFRINNNRCRFVHHNNFCIVGST
jgi:hypothetical protein